MNEALRISSASMLMKVVMEDTVLETYKGAYGIRKGRCQMTSLRYTAISLIVCSR